MKIENGKWKECLYRISTFYLHQFSIFSFLFSTMFLFIMITHPAQASYLELGDLEEEAQIGTTLVTGNAADDKTLIGSAANAASWVTIPTCATAGVSKLLYTTASNTLSCGIDVKKGVWTSSGGIFSIDTNYILSGDQINYVSRETDGAGQIAHVLNTENTFPTAGAKLISVANAGTAKLTIDKDGKIGISTTAIPHGGVGLAQLAIEGTASSLSDGPHVQYTVNSDNYPVFQQLNWDHDNISLNFDSYYDGSWRSSDAGSNFQIYKLSDKLLFRYASGVAAGSAVTWSEGMAIDTTGNIGMGTSAPAARLDVASGSNTTGIYLRGLAETTEIANIWMRATSGAIAFDTTPGSNTNAYIALFPEDANYGLILRQGNGVSTNYANLYVNDTAADYFNMVVNATNGTKNLIVASSDNVGIGTTAPANKFEVVGGIRMAIRDVDGTGSGYTTMDMSTSGDIGYDLAEAMWVDHRVDEANLVSIDPNTMIKLILSKGAYDKNLVGVVSSIHIFNPRAFPGLQLGSPEEMEEKYPERKYRFISLAGQVEARVNLENGPIEEGDWITSSSTPGVGMKATKYGAVVGKALESFKEIKKGKKEGRILMLVSPHQLGNNYLDKEINLLKQEQMLLEEELLKKDDLNQEQSQFLKHQMGIDDKQNQMLEENSIIISKIDEEIKGLEVGEIK